jgi:quinol monooxygenase YgiN
MRHYEAPDERQGMDTILVHARFTVRPNQCDAFENLVSELTARAEREPGTRTFRFFRGAPGTYAVFEEFADANAALAHQAAVANLFAQVEKCSEEIWVCLHGPVGPRLREWAQHEPRATLYENPV